MVLGKLAIIVLFILSLFTTFTESQANESTLLLTDIQTLGPSPTPQQQDGLNSSMFLPPITTLFDQHLPTSSQSSGSVLQSSSNLVGSSSFRATSSLSILPSKSSFILLSTSTSVQARTMLVISEAVVVSTSLPITSPESSPTFMTPSTSAIMSTSLSRAPLSTTSPADSSTLSTTTVDIIPTPSSSNINPVPSIGMTGGDLAVGSTSVRRLTEMSRILQPTTVEVVMGSSISPSPTVMATTSPPVSMETMTIMILRTTTEDAVTVDETTVTKEEEDLLTRSTSSMGTGAGISTPAVVGMVVAACLVLIATTLLILVLYYCFRRGRKYEYRTGNEYRVTVQKWNTHYAYYTANQMQGDSVSSSRGSSIMSSFGFRSSNGKMKPRYGGVSASSDHVHSGATAEMYSTPL